MESDRLFREEVFDVRKQRLYGEVVLTQPLSTKIMVAALFAVIAIASVWVTQGTYSRIEMVPGMLVTNQPTAKIYASQQGIVTELTARDGAVVNKGDRLAVVKLDRQSENGRDVMGQTALSVDDRMRISEQQIGIADQRMNLERRRLSGVVAAAEQQIASLELQIELQAQVVASNRQISSKLPKSSNADLLAEWNLNDAVRP